MNKKSKRQKAEDRRYVISKDNPASMSWDELLRKHNGGSRNTPFGRIMEG